MKPVRYPDGHILHKNLKRALPYISHGEGPYLFDQAGKRYFDASGGAAVMSLGHNNQEIVQAITGQVQKLAYVNSHHFTSEQAEQLADRLIELAPKMGRVLFLNSGSEAVEAAIKLARQIAVENGEEGRTKLLARSPGYHGNTLLALSASGRPSYKKFFSPLLTSITTVAAPYSYRSEVSNYEKDGAQYYVGQIEEALEKELFYFSPDRDFLNPDSAKHGLTVSTQNTGQSQPQSRLSLH